MIPTLYERIEYVLTTTTPTWKKLGSLTDAISCVETSSINSEWEMVLEYPMNGRHANELQIMRIVWTTQPFYVYRIAKNVSAHVMTVYCRHINYLLSFVPAWPFNSSECTPTTYLSNVGPSDNIFKITSEINTKKNVGLLRESVPPSNLRDYMLNDRYGIIGQFGGEWVFDGLNCTHKARKGSTKNITIRYGVDLVDAKQEEAIDGLVTHIIPYAYVNQSFSVTKQIFDWIHQQVADKELDGTRYRDAAYSKYHTDQISETAAMYIRTNKTSEDSEKTVPLTRRFTGEPDVYSLPGANSIPFKRIGFVDILVAGECRASDLVSLYALDLDKTEQVQITTGYVSASSDSRTTKYVTNYYAYLSPQGFTVNYANMRTAAQAYVDSHPVTFPVDITVESLPAFMDGVKLGDTITVKFEDYGIDTQAEIMTMEYDVLRDQIQSYTLGTGRTSFAQTMLSQAKEINQLNGLVTAKSPS